MEKENDIIRARTETEGATGHKPKTSKLAITSASLGLLAFLLLYLRRGVLHPESIRTLMWNTVGLLWILGLIVGVLAIGRVMRPWERLKGGGFAVLGIILTTTGSFFWLMERFYPPSRMRPISWCERNLNHLGWAMHIYANDHNKQFPDPNQWCDLLLENTKVGVEHFVCPSLVVHWPRGGKIYIWPRPEKGRSHFAMNPDARLDSPEDTVLLFETKEGWNQHGGPELLSLGNHKGQRCNVLFNDGRVKFVRPEQIDKLKWKPEKVKRSDIPSTLPAGAGPSVLPSEAVKRVYGITGGFRNEDSTWFIAEFHNDTEYLVTKITIKIKLTDEKTGEESWHQLALGPPGAIIPPGETVVLSGDAGVTRKGKDFYWEVVEMLGYTD